MSQWIPVGFTKSADDLAPGNGVQNLVIGIFFLGILYQLMRGRKGGGAATGKKLKKDGTKNEEKKGGFFGGGGINDMMGMSKSNAKQFGGEDG